MRYKKESKLFDLSVMAGSVLILAYFGWHGFYGPRSVEQARQVRHRLTAIKAELTGISNKRKMLAARVSLLRPGSIDPDMLDEQARRILGFAGKNDLKVLLASD